jgi:hypothetical protein
VINSKKSEKEVEMNRKAQSMTEYAILFTVFLAALIAGQNYLKKAFTSRIKNSADSISSEQFGKGYKENTWSQVTSQEKTGTEDVISDSAWSQSTLTTNTTIGSYASRLGLTYEGNQVSKTDWNIEYNLNDSDSIFEE